VVQIKKALNYNYQKKSEARFHRVIAGHVPGAATRTLEVEIVSGALINRLVAQIQRYLVNGSPGRSR
jgi:hypothetical protein